MQTAVVRAAVVLRSRHRCQEIAIDLAFLPGIEYSGDSAHKFSGPRDTPSPPSVGNDYREGRGHSLKDRMAKEGF